MKTRAAVLWGPGQNWQIEEIEVDGPRQGEVVVAMKYCGMCHSDEHVRSGALPVPHFPFIGGAPDHAPGVHPGGVASADRVDRRRHGSRARQS